MSSAPGRPIGAIAELSEEKNSDVSSPAFAKKYPRLWGFLSKPRDSDNSWSTGTILIFWEHGVFKLCLHNRPMAESCFLTHQELGGALQDAEAGLSESKLKWRKNPRGGRKKKTVYIRTGGQEI